MPSEYTASSTTFFQNCKEDFPYIDRKSYNIMHQGVSNCGGFTVVVVFCTGFWNSSTQRPKTLLSKGVLVLLCEGILYA